MAYLAKRYGEMRVGFVVLSAVFAGLALVVLVRRLAFPCTLELTDDAILLPRAYPWRRITTIPYADIVSIRGGGELWIDTDTGSFTIWANRLKDYRAVREIISVKTAATVVESDSDEFPRPLVQWTEPQDWARFRTRAAISKPFVYQLRKELWFFVRCYAFCSVFLVLPCLAFVLLPWIFVLGPFQIGAVSIRAVAGASVLAMFITMLHWLYGIFPVGSETKISFRDQGVIVRFPSRQQFVWNYRQFCGWAVIERQFKGRILQILLLKRMVKGRDYDEAFALPDASVRDQVLQILNDRQVPQAPDLAPSWEAE